MKTRPAIVTVAFRCVVAVLAVTLRFTVPFPEPEPPDVTTIHETGLVVAGQVQPPAAATATLIDSPPAATLFLLVGLIANVHGGGPVNGLDTPLAELPPGPTADTRAS